MLLGQDGMREGPRPVKRDASVIRCTVVGHPGSSKRDGGTQFGSKVVQVMPHSWIQEEVEVAANL